MTTVAGVPNPIHCSSSIVMLSLAGYFLSRYASNVVIFS